MAAVRRTRFPESWEGLQINVCRNPTCENFDVEPRQSVGSARVRGDTYVALASSEPSAPFLLTCKLCKESFSLKSNRGIIEELYRIQAPLLADQEITCPNGACPPAEQPLTFSRCGKTPSGSQRYRCSRCKAIFAVSLRSTLRHRQPDKALQVLSLFINKSPLRRICEVADINAVTLYQRLDFLARQCTRFSASHERQLQSGMPFDRLHVETDRQDQFLNWGSQNDRRSVVFRTVASAEALSGYILGCHLNFDHSVNAEEAILESRSLGDHKVGEPFRRHARLRLPSEEFDRSSSDGETRAPIGATPGFGAQVYEEYTVYAHFMYLDALLRGVRRLQLSSDLESMNRAACMLAFRNRVKAGTFEMYFVRMRKSIKIDQRRAALARAEALLAEHRAKKPSLSDSELLQDMIRTRYEALEGAGVPRNKRWIVHPYPSMNEPYKEVLCLTDKPGIDRDRLIRGYGRANLRALDRFFMRLRRRVSLLERPIHTASQERTWHMNSAYNPQMLEKAITIFRTVHNYVLQDDKKRQTPAQMLGLAERAYALEDIVNFVPTLKIPTRRGSSTA